MVISVEDWKKKWRKNTANAGQDLVDGFEKASGMVAGMTSTAGINKFKTNVVSDLAIAVRNAKLTKTGDGGLKAGMREKGKSAYLKNTGLAVEKAGTAVAQFLSVIDATLPTLQAPTDDIDTNVDNRVKPIDHALRNKKKEIYGVK